MYTVIIAEKKHFEAIEQNKLYFKPFLDRLNKEFAFCEWIPEGKTLYECVPDLVRTVGRHKTWRAVIMKDDSLTLCQNPYDAISHQRIAECEERNRIINPADDADDTDDVSSADSADSIEEMTPIMFEKWKEDCNTRIQNMLAEKAEIFRDALSLPFQRLVTCLCFLPNEFLGKNIAKRSDIGDYVNEKLDSLNFEKYITDLEHIYHLEQDHLKNELRKECVEEMLPDDRASRRKGSMGIVLPSEVICFAERTTETGFFDAQVYWEKHNALEYSAFVGRNMYFDKMRFILSDILPATHQDYRYDHIRFLYNFLLLSLNDIPSGAVLPRRLYCLESENNEKMLRSIVTAYIGKLNSTIGLVESQIEKIKREIPKEMTDSDAEKLFCANVIVPVTFSEDFSEDELYVDQANYGYYSDAFGDEATNWLAQRKVTKNAVEKLVKQPRRALKKSVEKLDRECEVDYNMIRAMNSFQMDDVCEHTDAEKDKMVSMEMKNIFDTSRYHKELDEQSKEVMKVMSRRMKRKTTFILALTCLLLFAATFVPLLFTNRASFDTVSTALFFGFICSGALALIFVVTVMLLRLPLKRALNNFNQKVKEIGDDVRDAMKKYSDYLSCVTNIRRGYKVLNFSANNIDRFDKDIRTRRKHRIDMEKVRAFIYDNYGDFVDEDIVCDELATLPYNYDFGSDRVEYDYCPPYLPDDVTSIDFLAVGNKVELPSDFVTKITLRMEEIYD